jgi:hypothetical protein
MDIFDFRCNRSLPFPSRFSNTNVLLFKPFLEAYKLILALNVKVTRDERRIRGRERTNDRKV